MVDDFKGSIRQTVGLSCQQYLALFRLILYQLYDLYKLGFIGLIHTTHGMASSKQSVYNSNRIGLANTSHRPCKYSNICSCSCTPPELHEPSLTVRFWPLAWLTSVVGCSLDKYSILSYDLYVQVEYSTLSLLGNELRWWFLSRHKMQLLREYSQSCRPA